MSDFSAKGITVTFWLWVKPRSRRQRLVRTSSGELHLELPAPPVEGQANEAAVEFLARSLHLPRSSVEIVTGAKSRRKLFRITTNTPEVTIVQLNALKQEKSR